MNKIYLFLAMSFFAISSAKADIVCEATTSKGDSVTVTVDLVSNNPVLAKSVTIESPTTKATKTYVNLHQADDGMRILLSAPGLMFEVDYMYGCFRGANVISDSTGYGFRFLEPLHIGSCSGGTTNDGLCMSEDESL